MQRHGHFKGCTTGVPAPWAHVHIVWFFAPRVGESFRMFQVPSGCDGTPAETESGPTGRVGPLGLGLGRGHRSGRCLNSLVGPPKVTQSRGGTGRLDHSG